MEPIQKKMSAADTSHLARRQRFNMIKDVAASALVITATGFALNFLPLSSGLAKEKKQAPTGQMTNLQNSNLETTVKNLLASNKKMLKSVTKMKNIDKISEKDVVGIETFDGKQVLFFKYGIAVIAQDSTGKLDVEFVVSKKEIKTFEVRPHPAHPGEGAIAINGEVRWFFLTENGKLQIYDGGAVPTLVEETQQGIIRTLTGNIIPVKNIAFDLHWGGKMHIHTARLDGSNDTTTVRIPPDILKAVTGKENIWDVGARDVVAQDMQENMFAFFFKHGYVVVYLEGNKKSEFFHKTVGAEIKKGELRAPYLMDNWEVYLNGEYDQTVVVNNCGVRPIISVY